MAKGWPFPATSYQVAIRYESLDRFGLKTVVLLGGLFDAEDFDNAGVLGVDGNAVGLEVVEVGAEGKRWAAETHQPPSEEMMTL